MPAPTTSSEVIPVNLTGNISIDALIFGKRWASSTITYSFPGNDSYWSTDPSKGYGPTNGEGEPWNLQAFMPLAASDQTYFSTALQQWVNVANVQFRLVAESQYAVGDIRVAYSEAKDMADAEAWSYLPLGTGFAAGGDIWIKSSSSSAQEPWIPGSYAFLTVMHEIGHALGLDHPFEARGFPSSMDTMSSTIMSYSALPGNQNSAFDFYPTTPMPLDILAIQHVYGANTTYHREDNRYQYDDARTYHETIWDSGGIDWIEYSGAQIAIIDLREGEGSLIGNAVLVGDSVSADLAQNIWIAYGAVIENASGGQGDDLLIGNRYNNILSGSGGHDDLIGREGDDTLSGGTGMDTAVFLGPRAHYAVSKSQGGYTVIDQTGADGQDSVAEIERLEFSDIGLALDMEGHAGQVAKFLGAVFGAESVNNKEYVSIGLSLLDNGMSNEALATVALDAAGARTHNETVMLLWRNLFGINPAQEQKRPYLQMLDSGEVSAAALTVFAADTPINTDNIHLVGLMQSGIEFALQSGNLA
ncbi:M10 family metallopeptidase [Nitrosomonas sp. Nm132]|uniref:M10 family metallopeptidase n=1 Tax=Nitrosomonas sp. Nm132 TaxID=1881053 RepID=UPI00088F597F|nr:M10 family metallopeptidase [Nitrosomonas sp. Nm132]SDH48919.1 Matrixin [Nitrosomonas sp. Nm132]